MAMYIHVFVKDGDFYVSDSNAGDDVLYKLAETNPEAEVIVKDRDTGEALTDRLPLQDYLQEHDQLIVISPNNA